MTRVTVLASSYIIWQVLVAKIFDTKFYILFRDIQPDIKIKLRFCGRHQIFSTNSIVCFSFEKSFHKRIEEKKLIFKDWWLLYRTATVACQCFKEQCWMIWFIDAFSSKCRNKHSISCALRSSWYYDLGKEQCYSSILKKTNFSEVQCS